MTTSSTQQKDPFWSFASWLKFSAVVAVVEQFSTHERMAVTLMKMFRALGMELQCLVRAEEVYHIFLNPDLNEMHILLCQGDEMYQNKKASIRIPLDGQDSWSWLFYKDKNIQLMENFCELIKPPTKEDELKLWNLLEKPAFYAVAPFCQRDIPLGYFVFVWRDPKTIPDLFKREELKLRESAINILNYLQGFIAKLLGNHYSLYRDTYLPKFMEANSRPVAILFADIRNFTSAFEAMRLRISGSANFSNPLVGLVKAYLSAASEIIAQPGIGRIDKFIGDGIMTIFGEYLSCPSTEECSSEKNQALISCLLSIYSGAMLIDAFKKLFKHFLELETIQSFMKDYNERFDLKIGVGINFGEATFDYFGASMVSDSDSSRLIGGYLEYTAIGDNVNTAQRFESIAGRPVSEVSMIERSDGRIKRNSNYTAPIILGRTVFLRIQAGLIRPRDGLLLADYYKSVIGLKGKGSVAEIYEIYPDEINGDFLLRTLTLVGLERISTSIKQYWKDGAFQFPDERAKELIECYCR